MSSSRIAPGIVVAYMRRILPLLPPKFRSAGQATALPPVQNDRATLPHILCAV